MRFFDGSEFVVCSSLLLVVYSMQNQRVFDPRFAFGFAWNFGGLFLRK